MTEDAKIIKNTEFKVRQDIATPFIDTLNFANRNDDLTILRFATNLPEGHIEQVRFICNKKFLKIIADTICKTLDYYPTKKS